jgi:hypothetical protein
MSNKFLKNFHLFNVNFIKNLTKKYKQKSVKNVLRLFSFDCSVCGIN